MAFCQPHIQRALKTLVMMYGVGSMQLWLHEKEIKRCSTCLL
jgi:hypothetical protein